MNSHFINFKFNTGAQTYLIPWGMFEWLKISHKHLLNSNVRLVNYLREKILFLGKCYLKNFFPHLGLSACIMLDLVRKVESVDTKVQDSHLSELLIK
ncbi:hypothetical protein PR048_017844 [Dryococelus australis]|uniref:Uncharacterized protein n=1 Tax=Dryococelus australis TaxID=614101 RepID=A0ABQ9HB82_9NEOP|nr:hypothetical protein PR048_017844 [Dryococelus australis]